MKSIHTGVRVLSEAEIEKIHRASLSVLETVGIHTPNARMLSILEKAGCRVDHERQNVHYPPRLIEEMVAGWRARGPRAEQQPLEPLTGFVSTEVFYIDYLSGVRRPGVMDDVLKGIALGRHLRNFPAPDALVLPSDVRPDAADLLTYQALYTYSEKPAGTYVLNPLAARGIIQMAKALGREVSFLLDTVSPLKIRKESLEMALLFADEGMPIGFCSLVSAMTTAPVTAAGSIALQNAEHLAGMVMLQCLGRRAECYPAMVHPSDPGSLICSFGSPYIARTSAACAQMAHWYGLTPTGNIALTDALAPDFQCGFEKALSLMLGACAGVRSIGGQGIVGADQGNSMEQLVIDDEWLSAYNHLLRGVEVTDETLALDVMLEVGQGQGFLATEHTLDHFREELFTSDLFQRRPWASADHARPLLSRAHERVAEWTGDWRELPVVITPSQKQEIDRIVQFTLRDIERS